MRLESPGREDGEDAAVPDEARALRHAGPHDDDLIDFTPELREKAIKAIAEYEIGPLFLRRCIATTISARRASLWCPGDVGGVNIDGPAAADPATGILYVTSRKGCTSRIIAPGKERDAIEPAPTGTTIAEYAVLRRPRCARGPDDLPLFKPPYSRITAIDMNTGEHLWWIPVGETPDRVRNHPMLEGRRRRRDRHGPRGDDDRHADTLLIYQGEASDGTPHLFAVDKKTGKQLGKVEVDGRDELRHDDVRARMAISTSCCRPGPKLTAMALPKD